MPVPTRHDRFIQAKCDRCGKTTKARQNGIGDLFVLDDELGPPLTDEGDFCATCCQTYDRENWLAWFRDHRPEVLIAFAQSLESDPMGKQVQ